MPPRQELGHQQTSKAFAFHVLDVKQPRIPFQEFLKKLLPAAKRLATQLYIAKLQQIEDVIDQGSLLRAAIQQPFKARVAMLVQRHELAIQDGWLFQFSQRIRDQ